MATALSSSLLLPVAGLAQTVPPPHLPPGAASAIRSPNAEEIRRQTQPAGQPEAAPRVSVKDRGAVREAPCPAQIANSPITVDLTQIDFVAPGGGTLPPEIARTLAPVSKDFVGTGKPIRLVCDVRDAANTALRNGNYLAAVRVPNQTLQSGKLTFEVVLGHITELHVRGDAGPLRSRLSSLLEKLRRLNPVNTREIERILLLAGDMPGLSVGLELSPAASGVPGEVVANITVERSRGTLLFNFQDYGSQQIGRYAGLARAEIYGLTGLADRTYVSAYTTTDIHEQQVVQAGHDFALTNSGLRLGGEFTYAWTHPDLSAFGGAADLKSDALLATVQLSYPIIRGLGANATIAGGFDLINQKVRVSGVPINIDRMRILFVRANGDIAERAPPGLAPAWHFGANVELRKGTTLFDASKKGQLVGGAFPTRFEGDPQAFELRAGVQAELRKRFGPGQEYAVTAAVDARGQYANHPLLAFEELAVGNLTIGRGYDPGATSGDRAVGASFELRAGKPVPASRSDLAVEALGFYDAVRIWNMDNAAENNRLLRSYGGGVRVSWGDHARLDLVYAHPMDKALSFDLKRASDRVLFSLVLRALPWRR